MMLIFYVTQILCSLAHFNATTIAGSHIIKNRIVSLFSLKVCGNNNCLSEYSKSGGNWGPDDDCCTRFQKFFNAIHNALCESYFHTELFFSSGNAPRTLCVDMVRASAG